MYRLFVTQDAARYRLDDQDESLEELVKRATKYDEQGLHWIISDESGRPVKLSEVYRQAIESIVALFHVRRSGY